VVAPRQPTEIAEALKEIYDDPAHAQKLAINSKGQIINLLSWESYSKRMLSLIKDSERQLT